LDEVEILGIRAYLTECGPSVPNQCCYNQYYSNDTPDIQNLLLHHFYFSKIIQFIYVLYLSTFDVTKMRSFKSRNIAENTHFYFWGFTPSFIGKNTVTLYAENQFLIDNRNKLI
jgi:hypothetical protein